MNMSSFLNPYERFTKEELNKQGFKLAFIDNNFLSYLTQTIIDPEKKSEIIKVFKFHQIKPVLNNFVFYEFMKGLKPSLPDYKDLVLKKKQVAQFLDELKALWILNYERILSFELLHVHNDVKENAHEFYKIYSSSPLDIMQNQKPFAVKGSDSYPCDKVMPFRYSPFSDSSKELVSPVITWLEYFEHVLKDLKWKDIEIIQEDWLSIDELAFQKKDELKKNKEVICKNRIKLMIRPLVGCEHLPSHEQYLLGEASKIYDSMILDFPNSVVLSYAPLYSIYDHFYWDTLKKWDSRKKKDKKLRDIYDRLHADMALSYCDYFLTNDGPIRENCKQIIQELKLQSSVLNYEKNLFNFMVP